MTQHCNIKFVWVPRNSIFLCLAWTLKQRTSPPQLWHRKVHCNAYSTIAKLSRNNTCSTALKVKIALGGLKNGYAHCLTPTDTHTKGNKWLWRAA